MCLSSLKAKDTGNGSVSTKQRDIACLFHAALQQQCDVKADRSTVFCCLSVLAGLYGVPVSSLKPDTVISDLYDGRGTQQLQLLGELNCQFEDLSAFETTAYSHGPYTILDFLRQSTLAAGTSFQSIYNEFWQRYLSSGRFGRYLTRLTGWCPTRRGEVKTWEDIFSDFLSSEGERGLH